MTRESSARSMGTWAFRALNRSPRVRFATAIGLVFHLLSTLTLIRLGGRDIASFVYLTGFIPIAILATVIQGNLFGVDRGGTLTALAMPVSLKTFCRVRFVAALSWTLCTLLIGWLVGVIWRGVAFLPVVLLQLAFVFLLCAIGEMLSALAPSSRTYTRTTGQTMSTAALVPLSVVSLLGISGASKLLTSGITIDKQAILAAACMITALAIEIASVVVIGNLFESRRDQIMNALRENP